ncbi:MAG: PH domain-containing protein [Pirellulaceae bacterium]
MDKVYRSKVDWWLWLVISVGVLVMLVSSVALLVNPPQDDVPAVWIALAMLVLAAFMVWILFSTYYIVTATDLLVRAAFFRWRIPLEQIIEVFPTHNPLSSPALSLDRLRVNYKRPSGRTWWVMISPNERDRFLDDLARAAGLDREQDWLMRRNDRQGE